MTQSYFPSIRNKKPIEEGGAIAKQGTGYEKHVTLSFCLEMISSDSYKEVWCDLHDDIVLVHNQTIELYEFVQIKNENHDQLWSLSLLCEKKKGKPSIFEKSLAHDDCAEAVCFRLVTSLPTKSDLSILTYPVASQNRQSNRQQVLLIAQEINKKVNNVSSPKGNTALFWLDNFIWDCRGTESSLQSENLVVLQKFLEQNNLFLTFQQRKDLYSLLIGDIEEAAKAKFNDGIEKKIIEREKWKTELLNKARSLETGISQTDSDDLLVSKMRAAAIDESFIKSAIDLRFGYNFALRDSPYLDSKGRKLRATAREVLAELQLLRANLEAGVINHNGVSFHQTCIAKLESLKNTIKDNSDIDLAFLQGCMYDITGRCQHHFIRSGNK